MSRIAFDLQEIEDEDAVDLGADEDVRWRRRRSFSRDDRLHRNLGGADDALQKAGASPMDGRRPSGHVAGDDEIAVADILEGQGIACATVDETAVADSHRLEQSRNGDRRGDGNLQVAFRQDHFAPAVEIGGDDAERNAKVLEFIGDAIERRNEIPKNELRIELGRHDPAADEIGEGNGTRPPELVEDGSAMRIEFDGQFAHLAAGGAGGVGRADDGADRCRGDGGRPDAEFVEGFADEDMGDAARSAATESKSNTLRTHDRHLPSESGAAPCLRQDQIRSISITIR